VSAVLVFVHLDLPQLALLQEKDTKEKTMPCVFCWRNSGYVGLSCGVALLHKERSAQDGNTGMSRSMTTSVSLDTDLSRQG